MRHPNPMTSNNEDPTRILRRCGRTFWVASFMLSPRVRHDLAVLYAFCRLVDDIADEGSGAMAAQQLDDIESMLRGTAPAEGIVRSFADLTRQRGVPLHPALELLEGVRGDLGVMAIQTETELVRYCYRVASTVGLMICHLLDVPKEGRAFGIDLGVAMQLTNIARDVAEDAANGRTYLPADWVDAESIYEAIRGDRAAAPAVVAATHRALDLASRYYRSADLGMRYLPRSARLGIYAASRNYERIGGVVRRLGTRSLSQRAYTSGTMKLSGLLHASASFVRSEAVVSRPPVAHDDSLHTALSPILVGTSA